VALAKAVVVPPARTKEEMAVAITVALVLLGAVEWTRKKELVSASEEFVHHQLALAAVGSLAADLHPECAIEKETMMKETQVEGRPWLLFLLLSYRCTMLGPASLWVALLLPR